MPQEERIHHKEETETIVNHNNYRSRRYGWSALGERRALRLGLWLALEQRAPQLALRVAGRAFVVVVVGVVASARPAAHRRLRRVVFFSSQLNEETKQFQTK